MHWHRTQYRSVKSRNCPCKLQERRYNFGGDAMPRLAEFLDLCSLTTGLLIRHYFVADAMYILNDGIFAANIDFVSDFLDASSDRFR